jgi:CheY-like chemotaxis protein
MNPWPSWAALDAMHETAFDTVLLDIVMPEMDGFDVLAAAKADPVTRTSRSS